jgi:hypothetical protein
MNTKHILLSVLTGSLFAAITAQAALDVTVTGSTAFRSAVYDRAATLFDAGSYSSVTYGGNTTYIGTMTNLPITQPALGSQVVYLRFSFSGSGLGMADVDAGNFLTTAQTGSSSASKRADLALSDVYPNSANPPLSLSDFDDSVVSVVPFAFGVHTNLYRTGVTNVTKDQAYDLMTDSGVIGSFYGMPQSYLGGSSTNVLYLVGRNSDSGTRITIFRDIGFYGNPTQWSTNGAGAFISVSGASSGGTVANLIGTYTNVVGYLGLSDLINSSGNNGVAMAYNGVPFSIANVQNGRYALWAKEQMVNKVGALTAAQAAVRDALYAALTDQGFQTTNGVYTNYFVDLANMKVDRNDDGGPITRN